MGTKFYISKTLNSSEKVIVKQHIDNDQYEEAINKLPKKIMIGSRSFGWKFLWVCHEFKFFKPTKESLFNWLRSGKITDEYGNEFTFDQFMNELSNDGYDLESYCRENSCTYYITEAHRLKYSKYPITINKFGEFYIEDLRFTVMHD